MNCPRCSTPLEAFRLTGGPEVDVCPKECGAWYDEGELSLPLSLKGLKKADVACPRCALSLWKGRSGGEGPELDYCTQCGGSWLDKGELEQLRKRAGSDAAVSKAGGVAPAAVAAAAAPLAGPKGAAKAEVKHVGKPSHKPPTYGHATEYWDEFLLYSPTEGFAWLVREKGHYTLVRPTSQRPQRNFFKVDAKTWVPVTGPEGVSVFSSYDYGRAVLDEVQGEVPWLARPGDLHEEAEAVNPPRILAVERSGKEEEHFLGDYVEPEEVWAGFGLKGKPPRRDGVHACQPFLRTPTRDQISKLSGVFALIFGGLLLFSFIGSRRTQVLSASGSVGGGTVWVTAPFRIERPRTICRLVLESSLVNAWFWYGVEVLNAREEATGEFSSQVQYFEGTDGGEAWSEGSRKGSALFTVLEPGEYRLRLTGEGGVERPDPSLHVPTKVTLQAGHIPARYFLWGLLLSLLTGLGLWVEPWAHEALRWAPVVEYDDDDD